MVLVPLFMLFISGAWTLASLIPYVRWGAMRETMFYTVIISNISFLVSLLLSMLFYLEVGEKETHKRTMVLAFSIGIIALIISIVVFTVSFVMQPPFFKAYPPD
jgi:tetrahydromethanopterin S-methyltransferase subunit C